MKRNEKPKPAISYSRVSPDGPGPTLGVQREAIERYATANGLGIGVELSDSGDGTDRYRPGMVRLLEEMATGKYSAVICYSLDRLATKVDHQMIFDCEAQHAGVELYVTSEPFDRAPEKWLIRKFEEYAAKQAAPLREFVRRVADLEIAFEYKVGTVDDLILLARQLLKEMK